MRRISNKRARSRFALLAAAAAGAAGVGLSSTTARADSGSWAVPAAGTWDNTANWTGGVIADGAGSTATFNLDVPVGGIAVSLDVARTLGQLSFGDTDPLTAGTWTLNSPGGGALTLSGTPTITVGTGSTANVALTLSGSEGLTTAGTGTLILTGVNNWTGGTTISAGTLQIGTGQAAAADLATLGTGPITNNGTLTVFKTNAMSINDAITGSGNLVKQGTGVLTLAGANSYTGTTSVTGGQVIFPNAAAVNGLAANSITVGPSGVVGYDGFSAVDPAFTSRFNAASTGTLAITGADAATNFDFTTPNLAPLAQMSLGTNTSMSYNGTVTPADGVYRFGGGSGTLILPNALTTGSLQLGGGPGNTGTVVLAANNTYAGLTTIVGGTVNVGNSTATGSFGPGDIVNNASILDTRTDSHTFANNMTGTGDFIRRNAGSGTATTLTITGNVTMDQLFIDRSNAAGGVTTVTVNGGSLVSNGQGGIQGGVGQGQLILTSGSIALNGGIQTDNNDAALIRVDGGTFTASDIGLARVGGTTNPAFGNGFVVTGGTATVGTLRVGRTNANSWGIASFEGGTTTITGAMTVGQTTNGGRGGAFRVIGGTFNATDTVDGVVMGRTNGATTSQASRAFFSGGVANIEKFKMGFDNTLIGGESQVNVQAGGTLYVGSGGFEKPTPATHLANVNFSGGTLAAKANWTAAPGVNFAITGATNPTFKAADAADAPFNMTLNGVVSGAGARTKTGGGTLTLNGVNTYTGAVTVSAGTLAGTTSGLRGNIANAANVTFDQATNGTFTGVISGAGTLTKTGAGTATLAAGQTYTGATTVLGGALAINGPQTTSGITVGNGATLALASNATVNALTLGMTPTDVSNLRVNTGAGVNSLGVLTADALTLNGSATIDIGSVGLTAGTYPVLDYSGAIGGSGYNFTLGSLPPRISASLVNNTANTSVDLVVGGVDVPRWTGAVNGTWDIGTPDLTTGTQNWKETTSGNNTVYLQATAPGDLVVFDDTATGSTNVNIAVPVSPGRVAADNSTKNYTFTGAKISGPAELVKQGTGSLTLSNVGNDYAGGTTVSAGTLQLGGANALPVAGRVTVAGGTLNLGGNAQDLSGQFILDGGTVTNGTVNKTGTVYDMRSGTVDATASLAGPVALEKTTPGTVVITGTPAHTGLTTVTEGVLQFGDGVTNGNFNGNITNTGTVRFNPGVDQVYTGSITGFTGTIEKNGPNALRITNTNEGNATINGGVVTLAGNNSNNARLGRGGVITINDGATVSTTGISALGLNSAANPAQVRLNAGGTLRGELDSDTSLYNATFAGGLLTSDEFSAWNFRGDYVVTGGTTSTISAPTVALNNDVIFNVDAGSTMNISSALTGATSLRKSGAGDMRITGNNTYTTTTSVDSGRLFVPTPASLPNYATANQARVIGNGTLVLNVGGAGEWGETELTSLLGAAEFTGNARVGLDTTNAGGSFTYAPAITRAHGVTKLGPGTLALTGTNTYTGPTTVDAGTLQVRRMHETTAVTVNAGGKLQVLDSSPTLPLHPSGDNAFVSRPTALAIANNGAAIGSRIYSGQLDLGNNDLILDYTDPLASPLADIQDMIRAGYNGGDWLGNGITSSTANANRNFAIGVADNANLAIPFDGTRLFSGQVVDTTTILVKFTHRIDLDLDGVITTNDATIFNSRYSEGAPAYWSIGDLDYDRVFTTNDATLFNSFYNEALASVPEPATLGVLGIGALGLLRRRRRGA